MTLRDILSIELASPARIRIDAQCEDYYYFYIDIDEDIREDPFIPQSASELCEL